MKVANFAVALTLTVVVVVLKTQTPPPPVVPLPVESSLERLGNYRSHAILGEGASKAAPPALFENLAGSGFEGDRDGVGLSAQFVDPVWLSKIPDDPDSILVLDDGAKALKTVRLSDREVRTVAHYAANERYDFAVKVGSEYFLAQALSRAVTKIDAQGVETVLTSPNLGEILMLGNDEGALLLLSQNPSALKKLKGAEMTTLVGLPAGARFDSLDTWGSYAFLACKNTHELVVCDLLAGRQTYRGALPFDLTSRLVYVAFREQLWAFSQKELFVADFDAKNGTLKGDWRKVEFKNLIGIPTGGNQDKGEFRTSWLHDVYSVLPDARGSLSIIDRENKRIMRLNGSRARSFTGTDDQGYFLGQVYDRVKPADTKRILWLSHSLQRDVQGTFFDEDRFMGAPRQAENILNTQDTTLQWEVLTPHLNGMDFFSSVYPKVEGSLDNFGFDNVFLLFDLQHVMNFLAHDGINTPASFGADGIPRGVDTQQEQLPILQRKYDPPLRELYAFLMEKYGPHSSDPLFTEKGEYIYWKTDEKKVLRIWMTDPKFRELILQIYSDLFSHLRDLTEKKGGRFTIFLVPSSNFLGVEDFVDTWGLGGGERRWNAEAAVHPIVKAFSERDLEVIDLTYPMLRLREMYFPFSGPGTPHNGILYHQALAQAVCQAAKEHHVITEIPGVLRAPRGNADEDRLRLRPNIVATAKGENTFVLHNLWDEPAQGDLDFRKPEAATAAVLVPLALRDIEENGVKGAKYEFLFAQVKAHDFYGGMDTKLTEKVATLSIQVAELETVKKLFAEKRWAELESKTLFEKAAKS